MTLDLTDEEELALAAELKQTIAEDRYPLSPASTPFRALLDKLEPPPARDPLPEPKHDEPPRFIRGRRRRGLKSEPGPADDPWRAAAAAGVRLIVWCKACGHQVEPDPGEHAERYGAEMPVLDWCDRLVCSQRGGREIDMVVTTGERRP
jgi:hypothetical protein